MSNIRLQSTKAIFSTLRQRAGSEKDNAAIETLTNNLEEAAYQHHNGDTGNAYREHMRELLLTFSKDNKQLCQQYLTGQIGADELVKMDAQDLRSQERAQRDTDLQEQNLRESIGATKIPVYATDDPGESREQAAERLPISGEQSAEAESMGEEGDFKHRAQPKIHGLEGIEFETGL